MTGLQLKLKRIKAGVKQYDLAARVGISPTTLCEIELGRRRALPELQKRILEAIGQHTLTASHKHETHALNRRNRNGEEQQHAIENSVSNQPNESHRS